MEPTLVLSALAASVASGAFLAAGLNLRKTQVSRDAREALTLFSLWWLSLAVYAVASATIDLSAALGVTAAGPLMLFHIMQAVALCIGLWGLMYYIAFVLTGRRVFLPLLAVFYATYYGIVLFFVALARPLAVAAEAFRARVLYANPIMDGAVTTLLLVLPPMVAASTYLAVYVQVKELSRRFRIVLVTTSTSAWFVAVLLRSGPGSLLPATTPLLALASGLAITWAYQPPRWVQRRLDQAQAAAPTASLPPADG